MEPAGAPRLRKGKLGGHRLIRIGGQGVAAAFSSQATQARADPFAFLRSVGLLAFRWWGAGVIRGLRRIGRFGFKRLDARGQELNLRPERQDQGVLLGVAQVGEGRWRGYLTVRIESSVTLSRKMSPPKENLTPSWRVWMGLTERGMSSYLVRVQSYLLI